MKKYLVTIGILLIIYGTMIVPPVIAQEKNEESSSFSFTDVYGRPYEEAFTESGEYIYPPELKYTVGPFLSDKNTSYDDSIDKIIDDINWEHFLDQQRNLLNKYTELQKIEKLLINAKEKHIMQGYMNEASAKYGESSLLLLQENNNNNNNAIQDTNKPALIDVVKSIISQTKLGASILKDNISHSFDKLLKILDIREGWELELYDEFESQTIIVDDKEEEIDKMIESFGNQGDPIVFSLDKETPACTVKMWAEQHDSFHWFYPLYGFAQYSQKMDRTPCEGTFTVFIGDDMLWRYGKNAPNAYDAMKQYDSNRDGWLSKSDNSWSMVRIMDSDYTYHTPDSFTPEIVGFKYKDHIKYQDDKHGTGVYADHVLDGKEHFRIVAYQEKGIIFSDGTQMETFGSVQGAISDCSTYDIKYHFAEGYLLLKQYKKAAIGYKEIIDRCPESSHGIAGIASILHRLQYYEEAMMWYIWALQIDPENYYYLTDVAEILYLTGYKQEAKEILQYSYSLNSEHVWTKMLMDKWNIDF